MVSLAERLARARLEGGTVQVAAGEAPGDAVTAYAVQAAVAALLGPPSDAWKVGSTSAEAQAKLGTSEPGSARVPERYRFESGDAVPVHAAHDLWVEGEFALRLGRALPARDDDYTRTDILEAIDAAAPALEIVGSRISGGLGGAGRFLTTADGGADIALVTGDMVQDWQRFDLPSHSVRVHINGAVAGQGDGSRALGDPVNVMLWIANHQRRRDGLPAGAVISTGTCTGLQRVAPGDVLTGDFGELGTVVARLVEPAP